jgi:uncharacterized protein DUF4293
MIQRIQSILLLVVTAAIIVVFFFPLATFQNESLFYVYQLYVHKMVNMVPGTESIFADYFMLPLAGGLLIIAALAFVSIFFYKKRLLQLRLIKIDIFLNIIVIVVFFFFYMGAIERQLETIAVYDYFTVAMPMVSLLFLILGYRAILKDEKLVRAADRLR